MRAGRDAGQARGRLPGVLPAVQYRDDGGGEDRMSGIARFGVIRSSAGRAGLVVSEEACHPESRRGPGVRIRLTSKAAPGQQGRTSCSASATRSSDRHLTVGLTVTARRPAPRIGPGTEHADSFCHAARRGHGQSLAAAHFRLPGGSPRWPAPPVTSQVLALRDHLIGQQVTCVASRPVRGCSCRMGRTCGSTHPDRWQGGHLPLRGPDGLSSTHCAVLSWRQPYRSSARSPGAAHAQSGKRVHPSNLVKAVASGY